MLRLLAAWGAAGLLMTSPVHAQNQQFTDGDFVTLQGSLLRPQTFGEFGEPLTYVALDLAAPFDLSCTSDVSFCQPQGGQQRVHLVIMEDSDWEEFEAGLNGPALVTGELFHRFNGNHMTPVMLQVEHIQRLKSLPISVSDGHYVDHPGYCGLPHGDHVSDTFREAFVASGSISVRAYESLCTAEAVASSGDGALNIDWQCQAEGEEFERASPIIVLSDDSFVADDRLLTRCFDERSAGSQLEPPALDIDLRPAHADKLHYGSRVGMTVTLGATRGRGTRTASIEVEHTSKDAYDFCALYLGQPTSRCITETLRLPILETVGADCHTGEFHDLLGHTYRFEGPAPKGSSTEYLILDRRSGEHLTGSSASGYYTTLTLYQVLCRPSELERPLLSLASYSAEFDRLREWQGQPLTIGGGPADLPISLYALKARPELGSRLWKALGSSRLLMSGQFGFAANEGASLLVDFVRREVLICMPDLERPGRPVSFRAGTAIANGLDGFGVTCPSTIEEALLEYAPLIDSGQKFESSGLDGEWLGLDWNAIDHHKDLLGVGKVVYHDQCQPQPSFNPEWFSVFGSNSILEGRFEAGGISCHISDSRYGEEHDSLEIEAVCANAGYTPGYYTHSISRPRAGALRVDERPASQCASQYFAALDYHGAGRRAAPEPVVHTPAPSTISEWSGRRGLSLFKFHELDVSLALFRDKPTESATSVAITGSRGGELLFSAEVEAGGSGYGGLGVFPMGDGHQPTLVFSSFIGGASCCTNIVAVGLEAEDPAVQVVGSFYGDEWGPQDLDGDGSFEFLRHDARFNYLYGGPGASFLPPIVYTLGEKTVLDATSDVRFRPVIKAEISKASAWCGGARGWSVPACLAWAAIGARLGTYDSTMRVMEQRFEASKLPEDWQGAAEFDRFRGTIEAHLIEFSYLERQLTNADKWSGVVCDFFIERISRFGGERQVIGEGNLRFTEEGAEIRNGEWHTDSRERKMPFPRDALPISADGLLAGKLPIYYLFVQPGELNTEPVLASIELPLSEWDASGPLTTEFRLDDAFTGAVTLAPCAGLRKTP